MTHSHRAGALTHYNEVSLYEVAFRSRKFDVDFFLRRAKELEAGAPILEFGAGAGRVTIPLAKAGHPVCAVDASLPMLERLNQRLGHSANAVQARVTPRHGDMRKLRMKQQFPLVLATFNVVGHLETYLDMGAFLRTAAHHLAPGGRLIFDVPIPHPEEVEADPEELHRVPRFKHPDTKQWVNQTERFEYDPGRQVLLVESEFRVASMPDPLVVPLTLRQWFPKEVDAILHYEGFTRVETFADYSDQPGVTATDTLIFSAARD